MALSSLACRVLFTRTKTQGAQLIGTRDHKAVRSHAQKHFIRLYRAGEPLPAKGVIAPSPSLCFISGLTRTDVVIESGAGYTLSGKPLDPNSSAARTYLRSTKDGRRRMREAASNASPAPSTPTSAKSGTQGQSLNESASSVISEGRERDRTRHGRT